MNILAIINGNSGLQYHRQTMPLTTLAENYQGDVTWSYTPTPEKLTVEDLKPYDIVYVLRECVKSRPKNEIKTKRGETVVSAADGNWLFNEDQRFISTVKEAGKKLVFDIDDNWQLPNYHGLWESHRAFNIEKRTLNVLKQADLVTTTTPHFAQHISTYTSAPVEVFPNAIQTKDPQWENVNITSPLVRFGWIGGTHHRQDIEMLRSGIAAAYRELEDFQFCLSFDYNDEYMHHEKIFSNNYNLPNDYRKHLLQQLNLIRSENYKAHQEKRTPVRPTFVGEHYSYHQRYRRLWSKDVGGYATLYNEIDVALVPLRSNNFNKYKSELKLIEAGMMGKAAIVTKVKPYDHFPEECVHFVDEADMNYGWIEAFEAMMDKDYRDQKAKNLEEYVRENYDMDKITAKRYEVFKKLIA